MMHPDANVAVYVCVTPVDMRKQASTLALLVEQALKKNIFEPGLYVFSNHRRDRIKIVYWQRNDQAICSGAFIVHLFVKCLKILMFGFQRWPDTGFLCAPVRL